MKNIKSQLYLLCLILVGTIISSCKDDDYQPQTDLAYEVIVDGSTATFKVTTEGVTGYNWDFGDGESSSEANPSHTYPGKGKYVPTLTAMVNGKTAESSTVLRIAKSSPVKINDNSLDDWSTVTKDVVTLGTSKGIFNTVKFDYDGNYICMQRWPAKKQMPTYLTSISILITMQEPAY
jgi:PKD repeat protein